MAKTRIHIIAKELDVTSKDVIAFLGEHKIEVTSASSSVEDDVADLVRKHFKGTASPVKKAESKEAEKADHAGTDAAKKDAETAAAKTEAETAPDGAERPKKKANISAVFNPQNSKMGGDRRPMQGRRPDGSRPQQGRPDGMRSQQGRPDGMRSPQGRPDGMHSQQGRLDGMRPQQNRPMNPGQRGSMVRRPDPAAQQSASERAEAVKAKFDKLLGVSHASQTKQEAPAKPTEAHHSEYTGRTLAPERPASRPAAESAGSADRDSRPQRVYRNGAPAEGQDRPQRVYRNGAPAEGQDRPQRVYRNGAPAEGQDRPQRVYRNGAPAGGQDRPQRVYRNGAPAEGQDRTQRVYRSGNASGADRGAQGRYGNDRGPRNDNNRGGRSFGNDRPVGQRNRFDQDLGRMNQGAAMGEEPRKESRDNRRGNAAQKQSHERSKGPKNQENLISLEKSTGKRKKPQQAPAPAEKKEDEIRTITLPEKMTIKELADAMKVQASAIVKKLFLKGIMVTVNQEIDYEKAEEIALEFNCICEMEEKVDVIEELLREEEEDASRLVKRPPVVCVMGHVDHGKTSLLDAIRDTHVIDREAGGITQHIGAYTVSCNGEKITFLDTPGHEAFTAMRMRGANATDIAILVVAADDGVMPQTIEAISHAKAAGVEIIVAINKIDKPSANVERVKQELSEYELIPEDWGGSTVFVPVSAHTHEGIDTLLEMILLTAEVAELKADPKRSARGLVIEAQLDKGRGAVATVLVQKGTLKVGQPIAAGSCYGKVRAMIDDKGKRVKEAGPSTPVEILGLNNVPNAGEVFVSTATEKEAKNFADTFISQGREKLLEETKGRMSLDDLFSQIQSGNVKELDIIVKADVQGSVEAVKQSLTKLSNEEVVVKVIHAGVGAINESDVSLASASNAIIIGFNIRPDAQAKASAEREGVDIRLYKVIYNAIEDVEAAMKGMLDPVYEEKILGHAEIRQIFKASGVGNIAGSYVLDGVFQRNCKIRITHEGEQIYEGTLASLKRFKDDVKEVKAGYECGLVFEGFNEFSELDVVEAYTMVEVAR